jgi:hypothetical protein
MQANSGNCLQANSKHIKATNITMSIAIANCWKTLQVHSPLNQVTAMFAVSRYTAELHQSQASAPHTLFDSLGLPSLVFGDSNLLPDLGCSFMLTSTIIFACTFCTLEETTRLRQVSSDARVTANRGESTALYQVSAELHIGTFTFVDAGSLIVD